MQENEIQFLAPSFHLAQLDITAAEGLRSETQCLSVCLSVCLSFQHLSPLHIFTNVIRYLATYIERTRHSRTTETLKHQGQRNEQKNGSSCNLRSRQGRPYLYSGTCKSSQSFSQWASSRAGINWNLHLNLTACNLHALGELPRKAPLATKLHPTAPKPRGMAGWEEYAEVSQEQPGAAALPSGHPAPYNHP